MLACLLDQGAGAQDSFGSGDEFRHGNSFLFLQIEFGFFEVVKDGHSTSWFR